MDAVVILNFLTAWKKLKDVSNDSFYFLFYFIFYIKRVLAKGKKLSIKKIPLVARPCKEDSRRNKNWGGQFNLV